jgi:hypothetical protein
MGMSNATPTILRPVTVAAECSRCDGALRIEFARPGSFAGYSTEPCDVCCWDATDGDGDGIEAGEPCACCGERLLSGERRLHFVDAQGVTRAVCPHAGCALWELTGKGKTEPEHVRRPAHWAVRLDERARVRAERAARAIDGSFASFELAREVA